ncbi:MAG: hypothetical protein JO131_02170, partial [Gammaproteobacteria bacterium]|nr:hypothetical protein [Gammaproteobacteria bacterium]
MSSSERKIQDIKKEVEVNSSAISIQYIWVGPPAQIPGQDVGGPIAMAKLNDINPIIFYCLEENKAYYSEKFKDYKSINIQSIQAYVEKQTDDASKVYMQTIMSTCLAGKDRGSIRDRVTVKDAFSIFLLQSANGYILDTNVIPIKDEKITLS